MRCPDLFGVTWLSLSPAAFKYGLQLCSWALEHPTAETIPHAFMRAFMRGVRGLRSVLAELETFGVIESAGEGLWRICDLQQYANEADPVPESVSRATDLSSARAEAGRKGGRRSAEVRAGANGTARPSVAPSEANSTEANHPASEAIEANRFASQFASKQTPRPPHTPPLPPEESQAAEVVAKDGPGIARASSSFDGNSGFFRNRSAALKKPIGERASAVTSGASAEFAGWSEPHKWPEVVAVAQALDPAIKLREYSQDSGVKAVVALFADGYELDELVRAVRSLKTTPYWLEKKRGLSGLTIEVVRREIAALSANAPKPQRKADPSERRIVGEDQGVIFYSDGTQATKSALASAV